MSHLPHVTRQRDDFWVPDYSNASLKICKDCPEYKKNNKMKTHFYAFLWVWVATALRLCFACSRAKIKFHHTGKKRFGELIK